MDKRIILIRHGEVVPDRTLNENPELSAHGREQCQRLAKILPITKVDLVVTSPLERAIGSAENMFGSDRKLLIMDHLAEIGQKASFAHRWSRKNTVAVASFEVTADLEERCRLIRRWLRDREEQIIAVVSHAGLLHHLTRTGQTALYLPKYNVLDIATWLFKYKPMRRLIQTIYHWGPSGWHHAEYRVYTINDDDDASLHKIKIHRRERLAAHPYLTTLASDDTLLSPSVVVPPRIPLAF